MSKASKLRFKEFSGDWESKKLGELGEFKKTYSFSRNVEGEGNYKHIHYGDIHMNYKGIISKDKYIPSINIPSDDSYEFIKERDIIFADASEDRKDLGKVAVVRDIEGNTLSGLHTICFRPNEILNSEFFLNHSLNKEYLRFMYTRGNGAKVLGISKSNLSEYKFLAPSKEEQEKIASFFSLIDDKISLQGKKVEELKVYKSAMMQKIFRGELRFKDDDGADYPEWRSIRLSEVLKERKTYLQKNEGLEHVTLSKDGIYGKGERYNRDFLVVTDDKKYKITRLGDICYNPANLKFGVICRNNYGDAIFSPIYVTFEVKCVADSEYMGAYLSRWDFINRVRKYEEGTVYERMAVKQEDFLRCEIKLPSIEEQKKIKGFFNKLNDKVKAEEEKLKRLNEYKKGLLQQMFM